MSSFAHQLVSASSCGATLIDARTPQALALLATTGSFTSARPYIFEHADGYTAAAVSSRLEAWVKTQKTLPPTEAWARAPRFILLGGPFGLYSGAVELHLGPLTLTETGKAHLKRHWLRGGLPGAFEAPSDADAFRFLEDWLSRLCHETLPRWGLSRQPHMTMRFLSMLAEQNGTALNALHASRILGLSRPSIKHLATTLQAAGLIRLVPGYTAGIAGRSVKSAACYLRDTGMLHSLLGIKSSFAMATKPHGIGSSWASYVIGQTCEALPESCDVYRYLSADGGSLDLVAVRDGKPFMVAAIRHYTASSVARGAVAAAKALGVDNRFLVIPARSWSRSLHGFEETELPSFLNAIRDLA